MQINRISKPTNRSPFNHQFEIHTIENVLIQTSNGTPLSLYEEYFSMIWIEKGTGEITLDLDKFPIEANTLYLLKPFQLLDFELSGNSKGFIICFDREFLELYERRVSELIYAQLLNNYGTSLVIKINEKKKNFMKSIAGEMLKEFNNYSDLRKEILKVLLKLFIINLCQHNEIGQQNNLQSRRMELATSFLTLLEKCFTTKKQVKEYAEILTVTPNYLNDIVKEITGITAGHHIQNRVILEAKRRAITEGYSLKEIAYNLGFLDPSHFSKYFKNSTGINFTDFKKENCNYF